MDQANVSKEDLVRRRDEINQQLDRVNRELAFELDNDPEEQAIQVEQSEVAVSMERNLRTELAGIEERLIDLETESGD